LDGSIRGNIKMAEDDRTFVWLMVGAFLGAVAVMVAKKSESPVFELFDPKLGWVAVPVHPFSARIPGWVGALVPTISAILFGTIGPMIAQRLAARKQLPRLG
jgi:hypothetical protein